NCNPRLQRRFWRHFWLRYPSMPAPVRHRAPAPALTLEQKAPPHPTARGVLPTPPACPAFSSIRPWPQSYQPCDGLTTVRTVNIYIAVGEIAGPNAADTFAQAKVSAAFGPAISPTAI